MKLIITIFLLLTISGGTFAQDTTRKAIKPDKTSIRPDTASPATKLNTKVVDGDTLPVVDVSATIIFPDMNFRNARELMKYDRLVYNVRKVYPYAKLAAQKLTEYKHVLDSLPNERERKKFIKTAQKQLEDQFSDELKKLSYSQGKVLIKLIYRETGNSTYDVVKELRGSFTAFIWQSMARLFGYDLRMQYLPETDDKAIERIVQMIEDGLI